MTKAMPLRGGTFFRNCSRASSPPAEAPMPTIGKEAPTRRLSDSGVDGVNSFTAFGGLRLAGLASGGLLKCHSHRFLDPGRLSCLDNASALQPLFRFNYILSNQVFGI